MTFTCGDGGSVLMLMRCVCCCWSWSVLVECRAGRVAAHVDRGTRDRAPAVPLAAGDLREHANVMAIDLLRALVVAGCRARRMRRGAREPLTTSTTHSRPLVATRRLDDDAAPRVLSAEADAVSDDLRAHYYGRCRPPPARCGLEAANGSVMRPPSRMD